MSKLDYSNPGNDGGVLPDNFIPWRWVLSYTVHPELLAPAKLGQERRFVVSVVRKVTNAEDPGYADLYERAMTIVKGRASRAQCAVPDAVLNTRMTTHGSRVVHAPKGESCMRLHNARCGISHRRRSWASRTDAANAGGSGEARWHDAGQSCLVS